MVPHVIYVQLIFRRSTLQETLHQDKAMQFRWAASAFEGSSRPGDVGRALLQSDSHFQDSHQFPSLYQSLASHLACSPLSRLVTFSPWSRPKVPMCSHVITSHSEEVLIVFVHVESNLMWSLHVWDYPNMCWNYWLISTKTAEQRQVSSVLQSRNCELNNSLGQLVNSSSLVTLMLLTKLSAGYVWK